MDTAEIDSNVLYRNGETEKGAAISTPRALIFDLKGGLGSLPEFGSAYYKPPEDPYALLADSSFLWEGVRYIKFISIFSLHMYMYI